LSKKRKPPSHDGRGNLLNRTDNRSWVGCLKFLNRGAVVNNGWVIVSRGKSKDSPKGTLIHNCPAIVIETICFIDVSRDGGQLYNPWLCRGRRDSSGGRGNILDRIHIYAVRVTAIQMMIARMETE
jgi:hypothetical protein